MHVNSTKPAQTRTIGKTLPKPIALAPGELHRVAAGSGGVLPKQDLLHFPPSVHGVKVLPH
jgi:hypothetical protein